MAHHHKNCVRSFRNAGLALEGPAVALLVNHLTQLEDEKEEEEVLRVIVMACKEKLEKIDTLIKRITPAIATEVLLSLTAEKKKATTRTESTLIIVDAFDLPRFTYHNVRKILTPAPHQRPLHGDANAKSEMLRDRYTLMRQRIMRYETFAPPTVQRGPNRTQYHELAAVESLAGTKGRRCVLGMLTQLVEGKWYLEEAGGQAVEIDLSGLDLYTQGMFTDHCMVLAEGVYHDDMFRVTTLGMPPIESRAKTLATFPQLDFFGLDLRGGGITSLAAYRTTLDAQLMERGEFIVMISDVHLDRPIVMRRLHKLFATFEENRPPLFVLMGNFSSKPVAGSEALRDYTRGFDALAELLAKFPGLKSSRFVFVPGPGDPGVGNVLPRPPIAEFFTQRIRTRLADMVTFTSNPARIMYFGHEMVFFREDLQNKMRRNCVLKPKMPNTEDESASSSSSSSGKRARHETKEPAAPKVEEKEGEPWDHLMGTLLHEAHLSPLPQTVRPIYWNFDHALRLYPMPHALIIGDNTDPCYSSVEDCTCLCPGSFSSRGEFTIYIPSRREVQPSRVDDTDLPPETDDDGSSAAPATDKRKA